MTLHSLIQAFLISTETDEINCKFGLQVNMMAYFKLFTVGTVIEC